MNKKGPISIQEIKSKVGKLAAQYGAERIYLFGSYARGEAKPESDIDLRVDKGQISGFFALGGLHSDLEESLGLHVDLLSTDSMDDHFLSRIRNEEILLYGKEQ